jgi:predicted PurR-regulated permease PerM
MARIVSFVVLLVIMLLIFGLFFRVMADFLVPMFLAVLLVIMFGPVQRWIKTRCKSHDRLAALLTTCVILLAFFLPASIILLQAAREGGNLYRNKIQKSKTAESNAPAAKEQAEAKVNSKTTESDAPVAKVQPAEDKDTSDDETQKGLDWAATRIVALGAKVGLEWKPEDIKDTMRAKLEQYLAPMALSTGQFLLSLVAGVFVMIISLYYFLADGPAMIRAIMRLTPLDDKYISQLIDQFGNVTQAVVMATFLSALAQGILAGIGFYFAGVGSVFLLTVLAILFAIIPFVGSAGVWVPVCLWIGFVDNRTWPAIILGTYCLAVVSTIDNLIKPLVLQGKSNMHPLLALLSVIGGVQALGPIGIIVGPMAVAFLQTLLEMVNKEMVAMSKAKQDEFVVSAK